MGGRGRRYDSRDRSRGRDRSRDRRPSRRDRSYDRNDRHGGGGNKIGDRTVYISNLSWKTSWQDLKDFCKEIGDVDHCEVLEYQDGRKTGSGIVTFRYAEDAERAIDDLYDQELDGRPIFIREDREGGRGPGMKGGKGKGKGKRSGGGGDGGDDKEKDSRQVYVGNLSYNTSWQDLKDVMKNVGDVEYCDVKEGGYGIVRYADKRDAEKAIEEITDTEIDGRKIFVREDREGGKI